MGHSQYKHESWLSDSPRQAWPRLPAPVHPSGQTRCITRIHRLYRPRKGFWHQATTARNQKKDMVGMSMNAPSDTEMTV